MCQLSPDKLCVFLVMQSVGIMAIGTFARMGTYVTMTTVATSMGIAEGAAHKVRA